MKKIITLDCKQGAVRSARFNVDGNFSLTCGSDKSLKLWNPITSTLLKTYSGHGYEVLDAQSSCDNTNICSCGLDKTVIYWDVASGKVLRKYRGHAVNCVSFNEQSTLILSGSIDGTVQIWDVKSRRMEPVQVLNEAKDSVTTIQVSDHEILVGSADCTIRRYDLRVGSMVVDCIGQPVTCVHLSKDGQSMLVSSLDSSVKLIDKETGEMLNEYTGHKNDNYKIDSCLSADDTKVFSGSEDGKVYIWDLVEAKFLDTLDHGSSVVHSLAHHPSKNTLITAAADKVYVWGDPIVE
ncbi:WD repeat domain-containing protein 83-like isoform X2 [Tubulanus polymorphus]|uniref:WD repeat domain-containing protein 83-like isoform X2 n=1 Tax=Tubulanus polymorphus TaxID=672921 RepID=UPI003DA5E440